MRGYESNSIKLVWQKISEVITAFRIIIVTSRCFQFLQNSLIPVLHQVSNHKFSKPEFNDHYRKIKRNFCNSALMLLIAPERHHSIARHG